MFALSSVVSHSMVLALNSDEQVSQRAATIVLDIYVLKGSINLVSRVTRFHLAKASSEAKKAVICQNAVAASSAIIECSLMVTLCLTQC